MQEYFRSCTVIISWWSSVLTKSSKGRCKGHTLDILSYNRQWLFRSHPAVWSRPLNVIYYQRKPLFPRWGKLRTGHLFQVRWAMGYSRKTSNRWGTLRKGGVEILGVINLKRKEISRVFMKNVEFPWVLTFGISTNKGRVSSWSEKSGKAREFGRESRKVRKIRDFLENKKVREKSRKFLSMQIFNINKKKIICTQKCVQLNCIWQSVVAICDALICI